MEFDEFEHCLSLVIPFQKLFLAHLHGDVFPLLPGKVEKDIGSQYDCQFEDNPEQLEPKVQS